MTLQDAKQMLQNEWDADKQKLEEEQEATAAARAELSEKERCLADAAQELVDDCWRSES